MPPSSSLPSPLFFQPFSPPPAKPSIHLSSSAPQQNQNKDIFPQISFSPFQLHQQTGFRDKLHRWFHRARSLYPALPKPNPESSFFRAATPCPSPIHKNLYSKLQHTRTVQVRTKPHSYIPTSPVSLCLRSTPLPPSKTDPVPLPPFPFQAKPTPATFTHVSSTSSQEEKPISLSAPRHFHRPKQIPFPSSSPSSRSSRPNPTPATLRLLTSHLAQARSSQEERGGGGELSCIPPCHLSTSRDQTAIRYDTIRILHSFFGRRWVELAPRRTVDDRI